MEVVSHDFLGLEPHVSAAGFGARSVWDDHVQLESG